MSSSPSRGRPASLVWMPRSSASVASRTFASRALLRASASLAFATFSLAIAASALCFACFSLALASSALLVACVALLSATRASPAAVAVRSPRSTVTTCRVRFWRFR